MAGTSKDCEEERNAHTELQWRPCESGGTSQSSGSPGNATKTRLDVYGSADRRETGPQCDSQGLIDHLTVPRRGPEWKRLDCATNFDGDLVCGTLKPYMNFAGNYKQDCKGGGNLSVICGECTRNFEFKTC